MYSRPAIDSIRTHGSYQRSDLLERAWALPVAARYAPLLSQSLLSICGPTSVANVLRSMGVPSGRNPLSKLGVRPMSLEQVVQESSPILPAGWTVSALRPADVDALRRELRRSNDPDHRYVANFTRKWLFGRGGGHHSPIGGYLEAEDLAFVLDVNARFGPWLVSTDRLFQAMDTPDWAGGFKRGLAHYERAAVTG